MLHQAGGEIWPLIRQNSAIYNIVRTCPLAVWEKIRLKSFAAGEFLLIKDEPNEYLYIIVEGSLAIHNISPQGKKYVIAIYQPGRCIGELEIMENRPCVSNVQARTDVKTLCINREEYFIWLDNDRQFNRFIMKTLCDKMYQFTVSTTSNTLESLVSRLAGFILDNSDEHGTIGYTVEEMADIMGGTARSISRTLREFRSNGSLQQNGHRLLVGDRELLEATRQQG